MLQPQDILAAQVLMSDVKNCPAGRQGYFCQAKDPDGALKLLPFKSVNITGTIAGPTITLNIEMKYKNPDDQPIECDYEFPLDPKTIFSSLECQIDDKVCKAVVKTKK